MLANKNVILSSGFHEFKLNPIRRNEAWLRIPKNKIEKLLFVFIVNARLFSELDKLFSKALTPRAVNSAYFNYLHKGETIINWIAFIILISIFDTDAIRSQTAMETYSAKLIGFFFNIIADRKKVDINSNIETQTVIREMFEYPIRRLFSIHHIE